MTVPTPAETTLATKHAPSGSAAIHGKQTPGIRKAVIVGGNRIPFARSGGAYSRSSNQDMLTAALDGLVARFGLAGEEIGEVAAGAVLKHSRDFNLTREAVLGSALAATTPAYDLQQACATGLEAVIRLSNKIKLGQIDSAIAGGVDSASDAPIAVSEGLRSILLDLNRAKTMAQKVKTLSRIRPKDLSPDAPSTGEPRTGLSMGEHQALTTAQWKISREAQDELALASHKNLASAYDRNFFDDLLTPFRGLNRDSNLRADSSMEKLAKLNPVFGKSLGEAGAVDFVHGKDGLLMAPAFAVPRLLARNGLTLADFDYFEIHEAFAGTVLSTLAAWEDDEFGITRLGLDGAFGSVDRAKLNVNGSSLAAGHPFAATGGRLIATLAKMLHERGQVDGRPARGLVSVCAAGGQGVVAILEAR